MRAVDCPCGIRLDRSNDAELFDALKRHAAEDHPDRYSDAELQLLVETSSYPVQNSR